MELSPLEEVRDAGSQSGMNCSPHLVLADVGGDDGRSAGEAIDFRHQMLRLDLARRWW